MRKRIILFALLFCSTFVLAQVKNTKIELESHTHDFGRINEADGEVRHTFVFKNVGSEPLVIYTINATCGCTVPQWDKTAVAPGKTGKVTVTFDPEDRPGGFIKPVDVLCNIEGGDFKLTLSGLVVPRPRTIMEDYPFVILDGLRVATKNLTVGNIPRGKVTFAELPIANESDKPLKIEVDATYLSEFITVTPLKNMLQPNERSEIKIKIDASKIDLWGDVKIFFSLIVNDVKQNGNISANATLVEDFSVLTKDQLKNAPYSEYSSYFYHFSDQPKGTKLEREFYLSNSGKDDLIIRFIDFNGASLKVSCDTKVIKTGQTATIKVLLKNTQSPGRVVETFKVITNDPGAPVREIRIMANIK